MLKQIMWCLAAVLPLAGLEAQTPVELEPDAAWTHRHSGISVPPVLGGIERDAAHAFAPDDLNIGLSFDGGGEALSVYVYRNTSGGVPVWFDQARWAIEHRDVYDGLIPAIAPGPFALPTGGAGLMTVYGGKSRDGVTATGLALFALGDWYVKIRASSRERDAAALQVWMMQAMNELVLPSELRREAVAGPVADCPTPLKFRRARDAKADGASAILGAMLGQMAATGKVRPADTQAPPPTWCRDSTLGRNIAAYRANESGEQYLLALGDSGVGVTVGPAPRLDALTAGGDRYSITMNEMARQVHYRDQTRLPSPERVMELIEANRVTSHMPTWGDTDKLTLDPSAF